MTINKVVISAAGEGTRMQTLSKDKPKHLIEVNRRPFLAYLLDNIFEAGYQEIILVVGYKQEAMKEFVESYRFKDTPQNITMVSQFELLGTKQEGKYGTACPLMCVQEYVKGEPFISLCGDNFYSVNDLRSMNVDDRYHYIGAREHATPEKFGVLLTEGEILKEIIEKPKEFAGNLINTSLYKFTPAIFEILPRISKSPRGEYEITDVISLLAKEKKVKVKVMKDYWMDFGRPEDVETFSKFQA